MSKRYSKDSFAEALDRRLSGFQADPWLAGRVISAGKGEKPVKKLSLGIVLVIVLLCILLTGAVAAVISGLTIGDFWAWFADKGQTVLPENYEELIRNNDISAENEHVTYHIPGYYYDGKTLTVAVNVQPKEDVLPIGIAVWDEPMKHNYLRTSVKENLTPGEYALKYHGGQVAEIRLEGVEDKDGKTMTCGAGGGEVLNEDGSMTIIMDLDMKEEVTPLPEQEIRLKISYEKSTVREGEKEPYAKSEAEYTLVPLTIRLTEAEKYICNEEVEIPGVGVKLTKVTLTVTPLEIWCALDGKVSDTAQWAERADSMMFEFVYPDEVEKGEEPRTVPWGAAGGYNHSGYDYEAPGGATFRVEYPISRDALGKTYAVRAFDAMTGERFDAVTFTVKPAEE